MSCLCVSFPYNKLMRIYDTATIKEELLTGFQSPCSEFAEKPLSFDERYGIGNPSIKLLTCDADFPQFGIFKNDQLLVDLAQKPNSKSLVVTIVDEEVKLFQGDKADHLNEMVCGVVKVIIRHLA